MKDFYFLLDGDIVRDVIEYPHDGYVKVTLQEAELPPGVNAGYYRLQDGFLILDESLKSEIEGPPETELSDVTVLGMEHVKMDLAVLDLKRQVAALTVEMNKKKSEIAELAQQNQILGSLLSSLQLQVLATKGGTDANV
ncbi:hypothetical protein [uncultured Paenibacillus sp.]|uniref:hypothetical protein n=1 Tax=uncultured Paenibacillus sp. TaxID=227322 RepID=UPI0015A92CE5|nr:hypothetical protein [uncultured Paenibacillus sp.]